jgi:biopolymer transport protein ExbD
MRIPTLTPKRIALAGTAVILAAGGAILLMPSGPHAGSGTAYDMAFRSAASPKLEAALSSEQREAAGSSRGDASPAVLPQKLIRRAKFTLEVARLDDAARHLESLAHRHGGYLAQAEGCREAGERGRRHLNLRFPSEHFEAALTSLRGEGRTLQESLSTEDVSRAYVDLDARIRNKRLAQARLRDILLTRTGRISEVVEAEQALTQVSEERDRAHGGPASPPRRGVGLLHRGGGSGLAAGARGDPLPLGAGFDLPQPSLGLPSRLRAAPRAGPRLASALEHPAGGGLAPLSFPPPRPAPGGPMSAMRSEINITPLIDIVLVLLIVFITLAPAMGRAWDVRLPEKGGPSLADPLPLRVERSGDGVLTLDGESLAPDQLHTRVAKVWATAKPEQRKAILRVHPDHPFRRAAELLDQVKGAAPDSSVALMKAGA